MVVRRRLPVPARQRRAEEHHHPGHLGDDAAEVLRAGDRVGHLAEPVGAEQVRQRLPDEVVLARVVDRDRVLRLEADLGPQAVRGGDALAVADQRVAQLLADGGVDGADGGLCVGGRGDDVASGAGLHHAERDQARLERADHPTGHGLRAQDDLADRRDRVGGVVRGGAVPAAAVEGDEQPVAGRQHGPGPGHDVTLRGQARHDVQRVRGVGAAPGGVQHALLDHPSGPVEALLAGLEHEHDVAGEGGAPGVQQVGGADQRRHVQVVPAGVHHAVDLAAVGHVELLVHRERIHVRPQQHDGSMAGSYAEAPAADRPLAPQHRGHAAQRATGRDLQVQAGQRLQDGLLGAGEVQADLGATVQPVPQLHEVVGQVSGLVNDGHGPSLGSAPCWSSRASTSTASVPPTAGACPPGSRPGSRTCCCCRRCAPTPAPSRRSSARAGPWSRRCASSVAGPVWRSPRGPRSATWWARCRGSRPPDGGSRRRSAREPRRSGSSACTCTPARPGPGARWTRSGSWPR